MKRSEYFDEELNDDVFEQVEKMVKCCGILRSSLGHVDLLEKSIMLLISERLLEDDKEASFRIWDKIKLDVEQYLYDCFGANFRCVVTFDESQSDDERNATVESIVDELQLISDMGRPIEMNRSSCRLTFEDYFVDALSEKVFTNAITNALSGKQCEVEFFDHGI